MDTKVIPNLCPKCQAPLPVDAPQGLCPKCLLAAVAMPTDAGQPAGRPAPPPLEIIAAAFPQLEILEFIGQGGMGFVFKARQPKLDRLVALKILPQSLAADPTFAERFNREAKLLARLNHPGIVTVHDFGVASHQLSTPNSQPFYYLLMEFVDGVNLRQAMQAGRFTPDQALAIVPKICEALQFAHNEGILHRDIKPENILLDAKGRVKIADFGIAKLMGDAAERSADLRSGASLLGDPNTPGRRPALQALTEAGKTLGTPNYMAPEQFEGSSEVDHRADIYSLGVVFYEMLTGELPLGRFAPPSQKSAADPRVDEVVLRALAREKTKRPASAEEMRTQVVTISTDSSRRDEPQTEKLNANEDKNESLLTSAATKKEPYFSRKVISGVVATIVLLLTIVAIFTHQFLANDSEWRAQPMKWGLANVSNPLASIRITAIEREKNIVIFKIVSDAGYPAHLMTAQFKGPSITNLPLSKEKYQYTGPDLSCLLSPSESTVGYGDGTSYIGDDLGGWMGIVAWTPTKVFHMSNKQIGPGEFLYGFYLPDEPMAALVVEKGRESLLGKTNLLGESANVLTFFDLKRRAGKDRAGNKRWQQLTGSLVVNPDYNVSFGPVMEQVLTMNGEEPSGCLNLVSGETVPLPKYALGGWLPAGAEVPPATSLPTGIGVFKRIPDLNEKLSFYTSGGMALRFLSNEHWESMSTAEVLTVARTMQTHPDPTANAGLVPPVTFLFKTPKGLAGLLQITGFTENPRGVKLRYKLVQNNITTTTPVSLPPAAAAQPRRSRFPSGIQVSTNNLNAYVVHDNVDAQYTLFHDGSFQSVTCRGWNNPQQGNWQDDYSITLADGGRTFGFLRESFNPDQLRVNGQDFDLRQGRVLTLNSDGTVRQLPLFPSLAVAKRADQVAGQVKNSVAGAGKFTFGPVVERTLTGDPMLPPTFLCLHDGASVFPPEEFKTNSSAKALENWWRGTKADFIAMVMEKKHLLVSLEVGGAKFTEVSSEKWDNASPADVTATLQINGSLQAVGEGGIVSYVLPEPVVLPATFAVESRIGEKGLLQIIGFTENPRGVKLRYKLVQSAGIIAVPSSGFIRQSGTYQLGGDGGGLALTPSPGGRVSFAITRAQGTGRETISIPDYFKQEGWFVYVESAERIWIFDGIRQLDVVAPDGRYSAGDLGVRALCPQEVWDAVPESARKFYRETQNSGDKSNLSNKTNGIINFKFLRVEVPKDSHRIEMYFERDKTYGLGIEVTQTAMPGPNGEHIPLDFWMEYGRQSKWVGVNSPNVLVWRLPSELSEDEIQAGVKELEQNARRWTKLYEGGNPEFAHIKNREGWTYVLWSHVLREPALRLVPSTPAASPLLKNAPAASPFREYPVNLTFAELAKKYPVDSPEIAAARLAMEVMGNDPTAAINRYAMDLPRLPDGAITLTMSAADRAWSRQNKPLKILVYRDDLAAVILRQQTNNLLHTAIWGRRHGQWKICLKADLAETSSLAEAENKFREQAAELYDNFQQLPDQQPTLMEEAGKELATNMAGMMSTMLNTSTQIVAQVPGMVSGLERMARDLDRQLNSHPEQLIKTTNAPSSP